MSHVILHRVAVGGPLDELPPTVHRSPKSPEQGTESRKNSTEGPWKGRLQLNVGRLRLGLYMVIRSAGEQRFSRTNLENLMKFSPKIDKNNLRSHAKFEKNVQQRF